MIEESMERVLEGLEKENFHTPRYSLDDSYPFNGLDQQMEVSFSIDASDVHESSLGGCEIKRKRRGSRERNPFRNMTNCHAGGPSPHKDLFYSFAKKTANSPLKPILKENRVSQETRVSEGDSICDLTPFGQEKKSGNVLLAEQLQQKIKLLDEKIAAKLGEIKSQFWKKRANSLTSKPTSSPPQEQPKLSLLAHLQKKHSLCDPPEALKDCYMKFIPMRGVLSYSQQPITNRKVVQSRLTQRLSLQFKCKE